jgi:hypothetical protein
VVGEEATTEGDEETRPGHDTACKAQIGKSYDGHAATSTRF